MKVYSSPWELLQKLNTNRSLALLQEYCNLPTIPAPPILNTTFKRGGGLIFEYSVCLNYTPPQTCGCSCPEEQQ